MDHVLAFLSDLMIFTGGILVVLLWLVVIVLVSVEVYDRLFPKKEEI